MAPHCTLRLSHLSVGGNTRGLEMVRPTRDVGAGLRGLLRPTAHGLLGRRTRAPASATWLGEVGVGRIEIPAFLEGGGRACAHFPRGVEFGAL